MKEDVCQSKFWMCRNADLDWFICGFVILSSSNYYSKLLKIRSLCVKKQTRHWKLWWNPWLLCLCCINFAHMFPISTFESEPKPPFQSVIVSLRWYTIDNISCSFFPLLLSLILLNFVQKLDWTDILMLLTTFSNFDFSQFCSITGLEWCIFNMGWCQFLQGLEEMNQYGIVPLLQMAADLLKDRLPEAREAARSIVMGMFKAFTENEEEKQETWQSFCQANLSPIHAQSLLKVTSSL